MKAKITERDSRGFPIRTIRSVLKPRLLALTLASAMTSLTPAFADVLVNYNSDSYVTSDANFSRMTTRTGTSPNWTWSTPFSDSAVLSPTSGYTGPAFYGGILYKVTSDPNTPTNPEPTRQQVRNNITSGGVTYDPITLQDTGYNPTGTVTWVGATLSFNAVFVFKLSNAASLSDMSARVSNNGGNAQWQSGATWRWVVQVDGNYYVSQNTFANPAFTVTLNTLSNPSDEKWAIYNPSLSLDFNQDSASFVTLDLSNVTAAGLYLENDSWAGDTSIQSLNASILSFTANGQAAIPEASSASLLTIGALLLMGMYKWRPEFSKKNCTS